MKKGEIKVGDYYIAKVSNKLTTVKITAIEHRPGTNYMKAGTVYRAVNQSTGREVSFASAASFRGEAEDPTKTTRVVEGTFVTPADEVTNHPDYTKSCDMPAQPGDDKKIGDSNVTWGQLFGRGKPTGGQHSSPQERTAEEEVAHKATLFKFDEPKSSVANIIKQATQPQPAAPHLIVQARAGTGKTTTLIGGIKVMMGIDPGITPSPQQQAVWDCMALSKGVKSICFVAFNKSIAEELKRRVPVGCEAMTMHGMGFKAVTRAFPKVRVNEHRVDDIIASLLNRDIRDIRRESPVFVSATKQLVNLCKMNLSETDVESLNELVDHYDIEFEGTDKAKVFDMVPKVLERCRDVQRDGCIDFSDMIWLPVALNLPVYKYGVVLVDEAQDLSKVQQELAKRAGQRLILCGDPSQAIYGFAGADSESMKRMGEELEGPKNADCPDCQFGRLRKNGFPCPRCRTTGRIGTGCIILPLTVTRRCGKAIVIEAKKYVSDFEAHESCPEGKVTYARFG